MKSNRELVSSIRNAESRNRALFNDSIAQRFAQIAGDDSVKSYVLVSHGSWAAGKSLGDAAKRLLRVCKSRKSNVMLFIVINDDAPVVDRYGSLVYNNDALALNVGLIGTLGGVLKNNKNES